MLEVNVAVVVLVSVRPSRYALPKPLKAIPPCAKVVPLPLIVPPVQFKDKGPVKVAVPVPFNVPLLKLTVPGMAAAELKVTVAPLRLIAPALVNVAPPRLCVPPVKPNMAPETMLNDPLLVPPPERFIMPFCTSTMPVLFMANPMSIVLVEVLLRNVPALLIEGAAPTIIVDKIISGLKVHNRARLIIEYCPVFAV